MMQQEETLVMQPANRPPKLLVFFEGQVHEYALTGYQTLGRAHAGNRPDLPLTSPVVSRQHGIFLTDEKGCRYQDVGSSNGTICGGKHL